MKIKDCMVVGAAVVNGSDSISAAAGSMAKEDVGMLVVEEDGKLAGVITDRDIAIKCVGQRHDPGKCTVEQHMASEVATVTRDADVFEAASLLRERHIKRLPVVDGPTVVGVVSITDLTQAMDQPFHDLLFGGGRTRRVPVAMLVGTVTHYFTNLRVAALNVHAPIHEGDRVRFVGHTTDLSETVKSMEVNHAKVDAAYPGDDVAISVGERVRVGDSVYVETD